MSHSLQIASYFNPWGFIPRSLLRSISRYHALRGNAYRASAINGMVSHAEHGNQSKLESEHQSA